MAQPLPGLHLPPGSKIKLKSWKGDYLHRPDLPLDITTWHTGVGNEWTVEEGSNEKIVLLSWKHDRLCRSDLPQGVIAGNGSSGEWTVEALSRTSIKLKSYKGDYLHRPDLPQGVTTWDADVGNVWAVEVVSLGSKWQ